MRIVSIGANEAGQRFDKFIRKYLPQAPSSFVYKMLRRKNITLNGKKAEGREMLAMGDKVKFFMADETLEKFGRLSGGAPEGTPCEHAGKANPAFSGTGAALCLSAFRKLKGIAVAYEDSNVLILDKPPGILTQKADDAQLSLNEWMIGYLLDSGAISAEQLTTFRPSVCNRLDRNTSGLVLCGKSLPGSQILSGLIRDRGVRKFYVTVVRGSLREPETLDGYLIKDEKNNQVTVLGSEGAALADGRLSRIRTSYLPLALGKAPDGTALTLLEVELFTGKTHQIRAHLSAIGHPLAGDAKYGDHSFNRMLQKSFGLEHQLLHACRLEFPQLEGALGKLSGRCVAAPLPGQFNRILKGCFTDIPEIMEGTALCRPGTPGA